MHPIAEQSDEQFVNESLGFSLQDSYSPLLTRNTISDANTTPNRDRSLSTGRFEDKFSRYFQMIHIIKYNFII